MKTAEVQQLEVGTTVYRVVFDIDEWNATVHAKVEECKVATDRFGSGHKFVASTYIWRGQEEQRSVSCRCCYLSHGEATQQLNRRVVAVRDVLNRMSKVGCLQ